MQEEDSGFESMKKYIASSSVCVGNFCKEGRKRTQNNSTEMLLSFGKYWKGESQISL